MNLGYNEKDIILVTNGKLAVEFCEQYKTGPLLILMDKVMPIMDGFEATKKIKALSLNIPFFIIGVSGTNDRDDALSCGMDDFTTKPYNSEKIQHLITKYEQELAEVLAIETGGDEVKQLAVC